jgi:hypothetical protein
MSKDQEDRSPGEPPSIARARITTEIANAVIAAEREARDAKTARLKALRLAKEAAAGIKETRREPGRPNADVNAAGEG